MKGRESGMPEAAYWASFFQAAEMLAQLVPSNPSGPIVEFGSGYGTFTLAAARLSRGPIIGFDIEPDLVQMVRNQARQAGLDNVQVDERDFVEQGTGLPDGFAVHVMLYNILHIEDPCTLLREAWRILRPGGFVSVIHWRRDIETPRGPSMAIRPTPEQCRAWAESAGFSEYTRIDLGMAAPWHFGQRYTKSVSASGALLQGGIE